MNTEQIHEVIEKKGPFGTEHVETTDSLFIRTLKHTYKINKPLNAKDNDIELSKQKKRFVEELNLNNYLAGEVYEEVVPISKDGKSNVQNKHNSSTINYALKMKKLHKKGNLLFKLKNKDDIDKKLIAHVSDKIAKFHKKSSVVKDSFSVTDYQQKFEELKRTKYFVLDLVGQKEFQIIRQSIEVSNDFLNSYRYYLQERVISGLTRDGHGNLAPENIYLSERPIIINRLFHKEDRIIDVLFDLARLGMAFDFYKRPELEEQLFISYMDSINRSITNQSASLFTYYKLYHLNRLITRFIDQVTVFDMNTNIENSIKEHFELMEKYVSELKY